MKKYKRLMKGITVAGLSVLLLISSLPVTVSADEEVKDTKEATETVEPVSDGSAEEVFDDTISDDTVSDDDLIGADEMKDTEDVTEIVEPVSDGSTEEVFDDTVSGDDLIEEEEELQEEVSDNTVSYDELTADKEEEEIQEEVEDEELLGLEIPEERLVHAYAYYDVNTFPNNTIDVNELPKLMVTFNGLPWYIIKDESMEGNTGSVTLLAGVPLFMSKFDDEGYSYSLSAIKKELDKLTAEGGSFADVADAIKTVEYLRTFVMRVPESIHGGLVDIYDTVTDVKIYLLSEEEAGALPTNVLKLPIRMLPDTVNTALWWLRSPLDVHKSTVKIVNGISGQYRGADYPVAYPLGVRPALNLDLSSVIFSSVNISGAIYTTRSGGSMVQNYFDVGNSRNAIETVTFTAYEAAKFPETSDYYKTTNGITVARISDTMVEVSGTPTSSERIEIMVPNAIRSQTISADDVTVTYGDTGKSVSAATDGNGTISYAVKTGSEDYIEVDASTGALTIKQVPADGKAYVTVTAAETDLFFEAAKDVCVTISPKEVTANITAEGRAYEQGNKTVNLTGGSLNGVLTGDVAELDTAGMTGTIKDPGAGAGKPVAVSWLRLKGTDAGNYKLIQPTGVTADIAKASLSDDIKGTASNISKTYLCSESVSDSADLNRFLPPDCGKVTISNVKKEGAVSYSREPSAKGSGISYTLSSQEGRKTGRITATVSSTNYEDLPVTINIIRDVLSLYEKVGRNYEVRTARTLLVDKSFTLVQMFAGDVANNKVLWESSNPDIAMVAQDGKVTAKSAGIAVITATSEEKIGGSEVFSKAECTVNVTEAVTALTLDKKKYSMGTGETVILNARVLPFTGVQTLEWKVNNDKVTIDVSGDTLSATVTGVDAGSATVTAYATDGSGKEANCTITVGTAVPGFEIFGKNNAADLAAGKTLQMNVKWGDGSNNAVPKNTDLIWTVDKPFVASVSAKGVLSGLSEGKVRVTATSIANPEKSAEEEIFVYVPVKNAALNMSSGVVSTADNGNSLQLSVNINSAIEGKRATGTVPGNQPSVEWSVDPAVKYKNCLVVSADGCVTVKDKNAGNISNIPVYATVRAYNGYENILTCKVSVKAANPLKGIKISKSALAIGEGNTADLTASLNPVNPDGPDGIIWSSENEEVAVVDRFGKVTAKTPGKVNIIATTVGTVKNRKGEDVPFSAACTVTVKPGITDIEFTNGPTQGQDSIKLATGKSYKLTTKYTLSGPGQAVSTVLNWTSTDSSVATVSKTGIVKAISPGMVTITAASADERAEGDAPSVSARFNVYAPATAVKIDKSKLSIGTLEGSQYGKIRIVEVLPANVTDPSISFTTDNTNIKIAALNPGQTLQGMDEADYKNANSNGKNGETGEPVVTRRGQYLAVKAVNPGVTTLTGITTDGSNKKVTCTVTIRGQVTALALKSVAANSITGLNGVVPIEGQPGKYNGTMKKNTSLTLTPVFSINGAEDTGDTKAAYNLYRKYTDLSVSYRSSDTSMATVNKSGKVTINRNAHSGADVTIYAADATGKIVVQYTVTVQ
ncbi:MAG: Ig-like domain-containing protein [Lachnospiraceae bacterium]|nr:Ig-like domain-containing protein [Lachnospiraceae bacterium]